MNWEIKRKRVTKEIAGLANEEDDRYAFEKKLKRQFKAKWVGGGAAREVYSLPCGLVVKVENYADQNDLEFSTWLEHPRLVPKIYGYLFGKAAMCGVPEYSIIVMRKARVLRRVPRKGSKWYSRYRRMCRKFEDVFPSNVGVIGGRLVLVDGGCGEGYTTYYTDGEIW